MGVQGRVIRPGEPVVLERFVRTRDQAVVWSVRWNSLVLFICSFFDDVKMLFKSNTGGCITSHRSAGSVFSCSLVSSVCHINIVVSKSLELLYPILRAVHPSRVPCRCRSTFSDTWWDSRKVPQAGKPTTRSWGSSWYAKCVGKLGRNIL